MTVCVIPSLFVQVIVVFAATVIVEGLKSELWMKTSFNPGSEVLVQLFKILRKTTRTAIPTDNRLVVPIIVFMMLIVMTIRHRRTVFVHWPGIIGKL